MYIFVAVVVFGLLISVHELGHFLAAKSADVKVNEFALGMGPIIIKRQKGETLYSLRLFPVGGFCAMEGENGDSSDPRAFEERSALRRLIILAAGSFMNFLLGLAVMLILFSGASAFYSTTISGFMDGFPLEGEGGIMAGDRILEIDGERIYIYSDISTFLSRGNGYSYDLVIERAGERIELDDFPLTLQEYVYNGAAQKKFGLIFGTEEATPATILSQAWYNAVDFVRLVRVSLFDLLTGSAGVSDLSGPIGIVNIMSDVGEQSTSAADAVANIAYLGAFLSINLAVMNMLPIPALDGGRIFSMFIVLIIEKAIRRKVNPKYEGYIHMAGFAALIGLMVFVAYSDIMKLIFR